MGEGSEGELRNRLEELERRVAQLEDAALEPTHSDPAPPPSRTGRFQPGSAGATSGDTADTERRGHLEDPRVLAMQMLVAGYTAAEVTSFLERMGFEEANEVMADLDAAPA